MTPNKKWVLGKEPINKNPVLRLNYIPKKILDCGGEDECLYEDDACMKHLGQYMENARGK